MPAVRGCGRVGALKSSRQPTTFICPLRLVALGKGRCRGRRAVQGCRAALSPQSGEQRNTPIPLDLNLYAAAAGIEDVALPIFTCLDSDIITPANQFAYWEALRSGLKALRVLGVHGVAVEVFWGIVEGAGPGKYDWSAYKQLLHLIRDEGFTAQVSLSFHATDTVPLPAWVAEIGRANPDIYFTDRGGARFTECLSLGVDDVPALGGRTALQVYGDLMASFRSEMGPLLGTTITDVLVGLGPDGDLKYPAHPRDKRWTFPGVGEFQCYDKHMLSVLKACAYQVNQPSWGHGGPHDAGSYCVWPHQTGFFHQHGNWGSPYGKFFLQWYSGLLARHADAVLAVARHTLLGPLPGSSAPPPAVSVSLTSSFSEEYGFGYGYEPVSGVLLPNGSPSSSVSYPSTASGVYDGGSYDSVRLYGGPPAVRLHARLAGAHWWYNTASHAPELTAGYYNTAIRDGYLPVMQVLAHHGVALRLRNADLRSSEAMPQAFCDPERQIAQQRTVAAALLVPVGLESGAPGPHPPRFDDAALGRLEAAAFDTAVHQGIELPQVQSLVFNRLCDSMFEPGNWARFKEFVRRVRNRADTLVGAAGGGGGQVQQLRRAAAVPVAGAAAAVAGEQAVEARVGGGGAGAGGGNASLQLV